MMATKENIFGFSDLSDFIQKILSQNSILRINIKCGFKRQVGSKVRSNRSVGLRNLVIFEVFERNFRPKNRFLKFHSKMTKLRWSDQHF